MRINNESVSGEEILRCFYISRLAHFQGSDVFTLHARQACFETLQHFMNFSRRLCSSDRSEAGRGLGSLAVGESLRRPRQHPSILDLQACSLASPHPQASAKPHYPSLLASIFTRQSRSWKGKRKLLSSIIKKTFIT